jgi:ABC-type nickel/cobalt efflux system permease component RcnA
MTPAVAIFGCIVAIPLTMLAMIVADEFLSRVAQLMLVVCAYLLLPLYALWILAGACTDKLERRRRGHMQRGRQIR